MIVWAHSTEHNKRAHKQVLIHLFLLPINYVFPDWSVDWLISAVINWIVTVKQVVNSKKLKKKKKKSFGTFTVCFNFNSQN